MKKMGSIKLGMAFIVIGAAMVFSAAGCAKTGSRQATANLAADAPNSHHGAQLWAEECSRCHNLRSPDMYSDAQWDVVSLHMRVRANLTPVESREILAFLKSAR